jgi:hypothetical protein
MKLKEISISKGIKVSIDYNSVSANISLSAEIDEGEDINEVFSQLSEFAEKMLDVEVDNQIEFLTIKQPKTF